MGYVEKDGVRLLRGEDRNEIKAWAENLLKVWAQTPTDSEELREFKNELHEALKASIEMPNNYVLHLDVVKILWRFVGSDMYAPTVYVSDDSVVL